MSTRPLLVAARALAVLALLVAGAGARGDTVAVVFADPSGFNEAAQLRLLRAAEATLRERSSWTVGEQAHPAPAGPRRRCEGDPTCALSLAAATGADHALLLSLGASAAGLAVDGTLVDVAARRATQHRVKGVSVDQPEPSMRELVDALLPGYARKGQGGLLVDAEPGSRIKVDGRAVATAPLREPLPVAAGSHEVDVLLPSGQGLLQRVTVPEGGSVPLPPEPARNLLAGTGAPAPGISGVRIASYAVWSAGAVAAATGLVLAGLAHAAGGQAQPQASPILLGVGAGLGAVGAGLFVFDLAGR